MLRRLNDGAPVARVLPSTAVSKGPAPLDLAAFRGRLDLDRIAVAGARATFSPWPASCSVPCSHVRRLVDAPPPPPPRPPGGGGGPPPPPPPPRLAPCGWMGAWNRQDTRLGRPRQWVPRPIRGLRFAACSRWTLGFSPCPDSLTASPVRVGAPSPGPRPPLTHATLGVRWRTARTCPVLFVNSETFHWKENLEAIHRWVDAGPAVSPGTHGARMARAKPWLMTLYAWTGRGPAPRPGGHAPTDRAPEPERLSLAPAKHAPVRWHGRRAAPIHRHPSQQSRHARVSPLASAREHGASSPVLQKDFAHAHCRRLGWASRHRPTTLRTRGRCAIPRTRGTTPTPSSTLPRLTGRPKCK
jgi:hypothetical protein